MNLGHLTLQNLQNEILDLQHQTFDKLEKIENQFTDLLNKTEAIEDSLKNKPSGYVSIYGGSAHPDCQHWQGRKQEIAQIEVWLESQEVTLIGIGGIGGQGKTSLAAKIYAEITGYDKLFWADLRDGLLFTIMARQALEHFGVTVPQRELDFIDALILALQNYRCLLVLDNLESLLVEGKFQDQIFYQPFFLRWVNTKSRSNVLVTSRERPQIKGFNHWIDLPGLEEVEGAGLLQEKGLRNAEEELTEFSRLVHGHPLLLRLVADLILEEYPQEPELERLQDLGLGGLRELLTDSRVVGEHHQRPEVGMVAVLDASWERLTPELQRVLTVVSVLRDEFEVEIVAVLTPLRLPPYQGWREEMSLLPSELGGREEIGEVENFLPSAEEMKATEKALRQLVRRSFLSETSEKGKRRFSFQPVIAAYVKLKVGLQRESHQRAIGYYRGKAKPQPWQSLADVQPYLEMFYHYGELGNWEAAFDVIRNDEGAGDVNEFLSLQGYYPVQVELYEKLLQNWSLGQEKWQYTASLTGLGNAYHSLGDSPQAINYHQQSLAIEQQIGDRGGEASSLNDLGNAYHSLGDSPQAINYYQQSLAIFQQIGDRRGEAISLGNLGNAYHSLGDSPQAINYYQQSLAIFQQIGDRRGEAISLGNLGNAYHSLGDYPQAINYHQQSLAIKQQIGDRGGEANSLNGLGNAYAQLKQYSVALDYLEQALIIQRDIKNRRGEANVLQSLCIVYQRCGRIQAGWQAGFQSQQILQELGVPLETIYPQWLKSLIRFAQRGKLQLILLCLGGLLAFPLMLIGFILLLIWRWIRGQFRSP